MNSKIKTLTQFSILSKHKSPGKNQKPAKKTKTKTKQTKKESL